MYGTLKPPLLPNFFVSCKGQNVWSRHDLVKKRLSGLYKTWNLNWVVLPNSRRGQKKTRTQNGSRLTLKNFTEEYVPLKVTTLKVSLESGRRGTSESSRQHTETDISERGSQTPLIRGMTKRFGTQGWTLGSITYISGQEVPRGSVHSCNVLYGQNERNRVPSLDR